MQGRHQRNVLPGPLSVPCLRVKLLVAQADALGPQTPARQEGKDSLQCLRQTLCSSKRPSVEDCMGGAGLPNFVE
jgi:hypothetical protein